TTGLRDTIKVSSALRIFTSDGVYAKNGTFTPVTTAGFEHFKTNAGTIAKVIDGTSNTIIIGEDATWRNHRSIFPNQASSAADPAAVAGIIAAADNESDGQGFRAINRWAEPECGNGVSGPPTADPNDANYKGGSLYVANGAYPGPWVNQ